MSKPAGVWRANRNGTVHWHEWYEADALTRAFLAATSRCGMAYCGFEVRETVDAVGVPGVPPEGSCATCRRLLAKDAERRARARE